MPDSLQSLSELLSDLRSFENLTVVIVAILVLITFCYWNLDPWRALIAWIATFSLQFGGSSFHLSISDLLLLPLAVGTLIYCLGKRWTAKPPAVLFVFVLLFLTFGNLVTGFRLGELPQWTWLNKDLGLIALLIPYFSILMLCRDQARTEKLIQVFVISISLINLVGLFLYGLSIFVGLETTVNYGGMRFRGFLLDPNGYAGLIGVAAIFQVAILSLKPRRGLTGILQTVNCFALLGGCFLTLSRGGLIALFAGGFVLMIFTKARKSLSIVVVFAGLAVAIFFLSSRTDLTSAVNRRTDDRENIDTRVDYMEQGMRMYLDSPLSMATGIGIGTFFHESPKFFGDQHQIHNTYVWLLVEGGPLILGAYLLLLYRALKNSYWVYRHAPQLRYAGAGCFCGLIAAIVWCMTVEGMYHHHVWILLAFSEALYAHSRKTVAVPHFQPKLSSSPRHYIPAFTQG